MSQPMYPPPPPPTAPPPMPPMGIVPPAQQVQGPAIGLLAAAGIGLLFVIIRLCMSALGMGMGALSSMNGGPSARYMHFLTGGIGIVFSIIGLAVAAFIVWAALRMKQLRDWNMSMAASIVAMIPCISPCCLIGLPIGIWGVIVLLKPEVKAAFAD